MPGAVCAQGGQRQGQGPGRPEAEQGTGGQGASRPGAPNPDAVLERHFLSVRLCARPPDPAPNLSPCVSYPGHRPDHTGLHLPRAPHLGERPPLACLSFLSVACEGRMALASQGGREST